MAHGTRYSEAELEKMAERFGRADVELVGEATVVETDETGGTAVMSVRLPRNVIAQLKALAEQRKTGATVLARDLIIEGLAAQPGRMSGTIPVAEVLQLVTAHGYVIGGRRAVSAAKTAKSTARKAPTRLAAKSAPVKATAKTTRGKRTTASAPNTSHRSS